ncbi:transposase [Paraliomyxa miuraensis]|uniref:transposase n=1 Tax=Paraliomyxa miuraensis TaxID=376150 RepID=UPI00225AEEA9|nr:transposase [Paraliomyxa miuraensis]MCX4239100.1 transposase [Paraliomyxa miuraensis]
MPPRPKRLPRHFRESRLRLGHAFEAQRFTDPARYAEQLAMVKAMADRANHWRSHEIRLPRGVQVVAMLDDDGRAVYAVDWGREPPPAPPTYFDDRCMAVELAWTVFMLRRPWAIDDERLQALVEHPPAPQARILGELLSIRFAAWARRAFGVMADACIETPPPDHPIDVLVDVFRDFTGLVQRYDARASVSILELSRDRKRLERLLRYVARPPVATERLHRRPDGKLLYLFRKPWRDGTRGVVLTPSELIEKLMALIPPPQANVLRYHGVLAPGSKLRARVVSDRRACTGHETSTGTDPWGCASAVPPPIVAVSRATLDEAVSITVPRRGISGIVGPIGIVESGRAPGRRTASRDGAVAEPMRPAMVIGLHDSACAEPRPRRRSSWAELMHRVFALDVLECPVCRGRMKIIAEITQPEVIERFLAALDLPIEPAEIGRARPPPQLELPLDEWPEQLGIDAMGEGA